LNANSLNSWTLLGHPTRCGRCSN